MMMKKRSTILVTIYSYVIISQSLVITKAFPTTTARLNVGALRNRQQGHRVIYQAQQQPNQEENQVDAKTTTNEAEVFEVEETAKEGGEGEEVLSEMDARLSDILPPVLSFSRNSVLFSEKPVTQRNNEVLTFWRWMKSTLPPVLTGAWPWRDPYLADENPLGAFYNILFVRLPVIAMGVVYAKNLREGHPLIMDYGDGPFEISPFIVLAVLALVLA